MPERTLVELPKMTERQLKGLWNKLESREDGCLVWTGATSNNLANIKYGRIFAGDYLSSNYKLVSVHRVVWLLSGKELRRGQYLRHTCGNSLCCRVEHLYIFVRAVKQPRKLFQRHANRRPAYGTDLPYGVYQTGGGYIARVTAARNIRHYLGWRKTSEEAAKLVEEKTESLRHESET